MSLFDDFDMSLIDKIQAEVARDVVFAQERRKAASTQEVAVIRQAGTLCQRIVAIELSVASFMNAGKLGRFVQKKTFDKMPNLVEGQRHTGDAYPYLTSGRTYLATDWFKIPVGQNSVQLWRVQLEDDISDEVLAWSHRNNRPEPRNIEFGAYTRSPLFVQRLLDDEMPQGNLEFRIVQSRDCGETQGDIYDARAQGGENANWPDAARFMLLQTVLNNAEQILA